MSSYETMAQYFLDEQCREGTHDEQRTRLWWRLVNSAVRKAAICRPESGKHDSARRVAVSRAASHDRALDVPGQSIRSSASTPSAPARRLATARPTLRTFRSI